MQRDNRHILDANVPGPVALLRDLLRSSRGRGGKMKVAHSLLVVQPMTLGRRHMSTQNTHDSPKQWTAFPGSIFNLQNKKPFSVSDTDTFSTLVHRPLTSHPDTKQQTSGHHLVHGLPNHEEQAGLVSPVSAEPGHSCPCLCVHVWELPQGTAAKSCHCASQWQMH